ncbi:hypothetical protein G6F22_012845 [Rhizopus arrhizus]|nr:hypothetical protein G6F22_012845 [Rhizopus arrhizus]
MVVGVGAATPLDGDGFFVVAAQRAGGGVAVGVGRRHAGQRRQVHLPVPLFQQGVDAFDDLRVRVPAEPRVAELRAGVAPHAIGDGAFAAVLADGHGMAGQLQGFIGGGFGIDADVHVDAATHAAADCIGDGLHAAWRRYLGIVFGYAAQGKAARLTGARVDPLPCVAVGVAPALPGGGGNGRQLVRFRILAGVDQRLDGLRFDQRLRRAFQRNVHAMLGIEVAAGQHAVFRRPAVQFHHHVARALQRACVHGARGRLGQVAGLRQKRQRDGAKR